MINSLTQTITGHLLETRVCSVIARSNLTSAVGHCRGNWMTSHFLYASPIHMTPSGTDYVTLMPFPVGMNCVQAPENIIHILLSCQSTERAWEGLNPELNCAHFSLTSPEIRAADTKEVLKACFDSNRLERVAFFSSPAQIVCVWSKSCLSHTFLLSLWICVSVYGSSSRNLNILFLFIVSARSH